MDDPSSPTLILPLVSMTNSSPISGGEPLLCLDPKERNACSYVVRSMSVLHIVNLRTKLVVALDGKMASHPEASAKKKLKMALMNVKVGKASDTKEEVSIFSDL